MRNVLKNVFRWLGIRLYTLGSPCSAVKWWNTQDSSLATVDSNSLRLHYKVLMGLLPDGDEPHPYIGQQKKPNGWLCISLDEISH